MKELEFNRTCRPLNLKYRDLFGSVPTIWEYSCTREEYVEALKKAIETRQLLDTLLPRKQRPDHKDVLI